MDKFRNTYLLTHLCIEREAWLQICIHFAHKLAVMFVMLVQRELTLNIDSSINKQHKIMTSHARSSQTNIIDSLISIQSNDATTFFIINNKQRVRSPL